MTDFGSATVRAYEAGRYEEAYVRVLAVIEEEPEALGACFSLLTRASA